MSYETLEVRDLAIPHLVERSIAFRAHDRNFMARRFAFRTIGSYLIFHTVSSVWRFSNVGGLAIRQLNENVSNLPNRQAKIDVNHVKSILGHIRCDSFGRILNDSDAATRLNCEKSRRAVIAPAA